MRVKLILTGVLLCLALAGAVIATLATVQAFQRFQQTRNLVLAGDVRSIRPWMTVHYISVIYHVPEDYLYQALNIPNPPPVKPALSLLAQYYNRPVDELIHEIQVAIETYRGQHPGYEPHSPPLSSPNANSSMTGTEKSMPAFLPALLNWLQQYSYPVLWGLIMVAAIGVPLPISLVLLAMGAFAALGDFNIGLLFALALSASVCGDSIGYFIGRLWGSKLLNWLAQPKGQFFISARTVERSREYFNRQGGWAVFLSRFLFSAFGSVINLLAGTELMPYRHFLLADILGKVLSASIPLALGYIFVASWEAVGDIVGAVSLLALALLVVIFLIWRLAKMAKSLEEKKGIVSNVELIGMQSSVPEMTDAATNTSISGQLPL